MDRRDVVKTFMNMTMRLWSGRVESDRVGSGRVGSGLIGSGRVGPGRVGPSRVVSGHHFPTSPDMLDEVWTGDAFYDRASPKNV